MTSDIERQTIELLSSTLEDEGKIVTYRWLSRNMGYSVNVAKQIMETYLSTVGKGKVHGTYYISRKDPQTGNQTITLVSQKEINTIIKDSNVTGYHIYSLEPSPLEDISQLTVINAEASQLQQGKDINTYRIVINKDVVVSKAKRPNAASKSKENKPAPSTSNTTPVAAAAAASTNSPSINNTKSKPAASSKSSVMNFFGKAATAAPKPQTTTPASTNSTPSPAVKAGTLNFKPVAQKRKAGSISGEVDKNSPRDKVDEISDNEVDSEEEIDRRLALNSRLDQDRTTVAESGKKNHAEPEELDINAIKKKQRNARLLAVDDDDEVEEEHYITQKPVSEEDEDEDDDFVSIKAKAEEARMILNEEKEKQRIALEKMMLQNDEDIQMSDVEIMDEQDSPKPQSPISPEKTLTSNSATPGRRRGHRAVTKKKTTVNDRGYMVTEDVVVMESFSEDDEPPVRPPPRVEKPAPIKAKAESSGPKKKAGTGNQSLLNFFKKQ